MSLAVFSSQAPAPGFLPSEFLEIVLYHLLLTLIYNPNDESSNFKPQEHLCSLNHPCRLAFAHVIWPFRILGLVSSTWNDAVSSTLQNIDLGEGSNGSDAFFKRVDAAYYPHVWHINTKIRKRILFRRYRAYKTIVTEHGDRGVYLAFDFASSDKGCSGAQIVVVKAWTSPDNQECVTEKNAYAALQPQSNHQPPLTGIPKVIKSAQDSGCGVYAIVLEHLGLTLEDMMGAVPGQRFDERMLLAVAIQMLDRYKSIHARGIIHNGIKPGNICIAPAPVPTNDEHSIPSTLYAIDFDLSYFLSSNGPYPDAQPRDAVGNRIFLSVCGHLGLTQSQRDDLESMAYLFSFLHHGRLPWSPTSSHSRSTERLVWLPSTAPTVRQDSQKATQAEPRTWQIKMATPASTLFRDMDESFLEFWKDMKGLAFGEVPNYDRMKRRFEERWQSNGYGGVPGEVDWWAIFESNSEAV